MNKPRNLIGRPKKEVDANQAAAIYDFGLEILAVFEQMIDEDWMALVNLPTVENVTEISSRIAFGHKLLGGRKSDDRLSLPSLICRAIKERDCSRYNATKQKRHVAFSIAAEGVHGIRKSREICQQEEERRRISNRVGSAEENA